MLTIQDRLTYVGLWPTAKGIEVATEERQIMARELQVLAAKLDAGALFVLWFCGHALLEQQKGGE